MVVAGCISAGGSIISGIVGMGAASSASRKAARERERLQAQLTSLENSRQAIINPYEGFKDLSSMISNPYANLGVATKSAEFEAEQIDLSLANTLDTLKETGASAGGATALANAALKSKQGISASLEAQEAQNEKLRAQGEQQMQQMRMAEAQRMQQAEAAGKEFMFSAKESRELQKLNRVASQLGGAAAQEAQASANYTGALTGMIGGLASIGSSMAAYGGSAANPAVESITSPGLTPAGLTSATGGLTPAGISAPLPQPAQYATIGERLAGLNVSNWGG
jgi:hypothetical protein